MRDASAWAGAGAAVLWALVCVRWFDVGAAWRPGWLAALPSALLILACLGALVCWLAGRWGRLRGEPFGPAAAGVALSLALAFFFRLPVVVGGAGAAVTADGALSGIVALHVLDGSQHLVFVPHVPYSGSLKSHVTALVATVLDPARSFALVSVLFYLGYLAGLARLARLVAGPRAAILAGLYAAFSPAFLTRYSLSNDGNYVEVLALGTWALWLVSRAALEPANRALLSLAAGLALGLGFWCHILAILYVIPIALLLLAVGRASAWRSLLTLAAGAILGYGPGWLWNLANGWDSFHYLLPGAAHTVGTGEAADFTAGGLGERLWLMLTDQAPVLLGYDTGYGPGLDRTLLAIAWLGVAMAAAATALVLRRALRERSWPLATLLLFAATNVAVVAAALPHLPGNPRYLLFLMSVLPLFLADAFGRRGWRAALLGVLIATGALASLGQVPKTLVQDARWRAFVGDLERERVRFCYTDFFLATRINFLSGERVVCSAKLGPFTTEYFFSYRSRVEQAAEAALIPVNQTAAARLERRLTQLGVSYERRDLVKPVLFRLSRKVDPEELFPGREFPIR
jgi:hypothetical protein